VYIQDKSKNQKLQQKSAEIPILLFTGADIGSDHELVMASIKIRLSRYMKPKNPRIKYELSKLNDPRIQAEFKARIGGKFAPLLLLNDHQETIDAFTAGMNDVVEEVLGRPRRIKQPWVTEETLELCDRRRELKKTRFASSSLSDE